MFNIYGIQAFKSLNFKWCKRKEDKSWKAGFVGRVCIVKSSGNEQYTLVDTVTVLALHIPAFNWDPQALLSWKPQTVSLVILKVNSNLEYLGYQLKRTFELSFFF